MSTRLDQAGLTWAGDACAYAVPDMYVDVWGKRASKDSVFRNDRTCSIIIEL